MPSRAIEIRRPAIASAPLLRTIGTTRVLRLDRIAGYDVDWVEFGAGEVTAVHRHEGIEHHFVASGTVRAERQGRSGVFAAGDYFFWDGRIAHTSFAERPGAAAMLMVRTGDGEREPAGDYWDRRGGEGGMSEPFDDGFGRVAIRAAEASAVETRAQAFLVLGAGAGDAKVGEERITMGGDRPLAVCLNPGRTRISVEADGPFAFMEFAA